MPNINDLLGKHTKPSVSGQVAQDLVWLYGVLAYNTGYIFAVQVCVY